MQLEQLHKRALENIGETDAAIFEAHKLFLDDPEFLGAIRAALTDEKINAEAAVAETAEGFAQQMLALEDEYFKARAQDIRDVSRRILYCLNGISLDQYKLSQPSVILADDLTPSDTIQFERAMILGLCTRHGGPTSHTAILARSLAVPAAVSIPFEFSNIAAGSDVILDGDAGTLTVEAGKEDIEICPFSTSKLGTSLAESIEICQRTCTQPGWQGGGDRCQYWWRGGCPPGSRIRRRGGGLAAD